MSRTLYWSIVPSDRFLTLYIHLEPTTLALVGQLTSDHVLFFMRASYFARIASCQHLCLIVCEKRQGSIVELIERSTLNNIDLREFVRDRVTIGCLLFSFGRKIDVLTEVRRG